jgi:hypothetical protein
MDIKNMNNLSNADLIKNLPTDKVLPSQDEIQMMDILFKNTSSYGINNLLKELKDVLVLGILFILFSIPQIDTLLNKFIPITTTSPYMLILIKAGIIMVFYWIIKHFYLMKK